MATKSIFKNICINDNNTAERLACALEHTSEKKEIDFAAPSYAGIPQTTQMKLSMYISHTVPGRPGAVFALRAREV